MTPSSIGAAAVAAFTEEFRTSLPAICTAIDAARHDRLDRVAAREAHRLIHALKGAASMVGLAAFGFLLNELEDVAEKGIAERGPLTDDVLDAVRDALPLLQSYVDTLLSGQSVEQVACALLARLRPNEAATDVDAIRSLIEIETREVAFESETVDPAPADAPIEPDPINALADLPLSMPSRPQPVMTESAPPKPPDTEFEIVPSTPMDAELAEIFALEAQEHLETIARVTAALNPSAVDRESIQELRRAVHTLKGAAGVVGYMGASKLAHRMEDLLDRLYEGTATLDAQGVRTLASSSDALHDMIAGPSDIPKLQAMVIRLFAEFDRLMGLTPVAT